MLSTQVLQEYFHVATRKLGLSREAARGRVEAYAKLEVVLLRPPLILSAIDLHRLNKLQFWDALLVVAAASAGCDRLFTEDLHHGQVINGVKIENPFA